MPNIVQGNAEYDIATAIGDVVYKYDYPGGLNLRPGSKLHEEIKTKILNHAREGRSAISKRFSSWRKVDETMTAFIPVDAKEKALKDKDSRKPTSIVFPYSYVVRETLLTYLVMAFFQDPVFRYEGSKPNDVIGAILLEKIIALHTQKSKVELALHTMLNDGLTYGVGLVSPGWRVDRGYRTIRGDDGTKDSVESVLYEGNELKNIDPYRCFPDPNVGVQRLQDGEFFGWLDQTSLTGMAHREYEEGGNIFNAQYLKHIKNKRSQFSTKETGRDSKINDSAHGDRLLAGVDDTVTNPVDVIYMYEYLIPRDWNLGESTRPEKWLFGLSQDAVIIQAQPLGLDHNLFSVAACAPDFDGYSALPLSRVETLYGLQGVLDFMFNSHVSNIRKALNDMFIVDPYLININDVENPGPGKLIRMRRPAWGRGVEGAIKQLAVTDVTRGNVADTDWIVRWMGNIGGADESMMGGLRQGGPERLTKGEFQGTRTGGMSRLQRIAKVIGLQAMQDIGHQFAANAQQLMSDEVYIKTTGTWQQQLVAEYGSSIKNDRMKVSPFDILIGYDVMVRDGSVPGSNFSESWVQMLGMIMKNPELGQQFDVVRIFKHIARSLGAKNVNDFVRQGGGVAPQTVTDDEASRQAERGNIIPINQMDQL